MRKLLVVSSMFLAASLAACVSAERTENPSMGSDVIRREMVIEREKQQPTRVDVEVRQDPPPAPPPVDVHIHDYR
jgi:hypothetical protein